MKDRIYWALSAIATFACLLTMTGTPTYAREVAALPDASSTVVGPQPETSLSVLKPISQVGQSGDYIDQVPVPEASRSFRAEIFDDTLTRELVERNAFNIRYEERGNYQLNHVEDYHRWLSHNQEVAEWAVRKLIHYHLEKNLIPRIEKSLQKKASEKSSSPGQSAAQAANTVYGVHKALKNTKINFGAETSGKFRFDMPKGLLEFVIRSPLVDTDFQYKAYGRRTGNVLGSASQQSERMSVGMRRSLSLIGGGVAHARYGLVSDTLSYGISRQIVGPISAQVDQSRHFSESHRDEFVYRVNFGANF
ncbi:MAG TPA: hypothetical protein PLH57_11100 [Oligoflexia bacterium]|nr:hypothetical protein [Oligoflexia bacterium]